MFKNTASQKIIFYAFDSTTNAPKTGDAANITAYVSIDGGAVTVLGDTSATEMSSTNAKGNYMFDLTQAETNGNTLNFSAKSSTANVVLYPVLLQTLPSCFGIAGGSAGGPLIAGSNAATTLLSLTVTNQTTFSDFVCADVTFSQFICTNQFLLSGGFLVGAATTFDKGLFINGLGPNGNAVTIIPAGSGGGVVVQAADGSAVELTASAGGPCVLMDTAGNAIDVTGTTHSALYTGPFSTTNASNDIRLGSTERTNIATAIWSTLTTAMTVAGSIGKAIVQFITGAGGAFNITITVKDNLGNLLQNVRYNGFDNGGNLLFTGLTNATGNLTGSYPAGNVTVALTKTNYMFAGAVRTVTGLNAGTLTNDLVMTIIAPPAPPVNPTEQTIFGTLVGLNGPAENAQVTFELVPVDNARPLTVSGNAFYFDKATATCDANGFFTIDLPQTILFDDPCFYHIVCTGAQIDIEGVELGAAPVDISDL